MRTDGLQSHIPPWRIKELDTLTSEGPHPSKQTYQQSQFGSWCVGARPGEGQCVPALSLEGSAHNDAGSYLRTKTCGTTRSTTSVLPGRTPLLREASGCACCRCPLLGRAWEAKGKQRPCSDWHCGPWGPPACPQLGAIPGVTDTSGKRLGSHPRAL